MSNKCLGPLYVLIAWTKAGKSRRWATKKGESFYSLNLSLEYVFLEFPVLCVFS